MFESYTDELIGSGRESEPLITTALAAEADVRSASSIQLCRKYDWKTREVNSSSDYFSFV